MEYQVYENECNKIRETNAGLLELFEKNLAAQGLSGRTIRRHMSNADIYINDFLLHDDIHPMENGVHMLNGYLGDFFIRKDLSSTPGAIRTAAASIKKFYRCMLEHGKIKKEDYDRLCWEIHDEMELWQEECAAFNACEGE